MTAKEGIRRIVRAISMLAWAVGALSLLGGTALLFGTEPFLSVVMWGAGAIAFAVLQSLAWIIAGFSGNPKESDGLLRWMSLRTWRNSGKKSKPIDPGPTGVGGWLLLLAINLLAFTPLRLIIEIHLTMTQTESAYPSLVSFPLWESYKIVIWIITAILCALMIVAGLKLRNRHEPSSVQFAIRTLWIAGPFAIVPIALANTLMIGTPLAEFFDVGMLREMAVSAGVALLWTLYLKWSRRVRNTYYHRLYWDSGPMVPATNRQEPTI